MAQVELIMPKMGESIIEATILKWVKQVGDTVKMDETILEIATDKVDSEVPSPVDGTIEKILYQENETIGVGETIAIIATESEELDDLPLLGQEGDQKYKNELHTSEKRGAELEEEPVQVTVNEGPSRVKNEQSGRFYSPLVRNIAKKEQISMEELEQIEGSGKEGRVTKNDILSYVARRGQSFGSIGEKRTDAGSSTPVIEKAGMQGEVEIIEMDRMRRLIADHMVKSKHTSPHVTSFIEVDVTNIVKWRQRKKEDFLSKYNEKITYTPIFIEAIVKAIRDYPMINISVQENKILVKKSINIGMATALPSGNLIVPVIKNADHMSLIGLTKAVNDLATRARSNRLKPEEIQDGTFTLTNVGTFGNVMGTPIINQPQVAILAAGAIRKKPAVLETEFGDVIAIRHLMFLSLSYDHRVVDGFLGGSFLRRIGDYLEQFDAERNV